MADNKELKIELGRDCVMVRPGYNGSRHNESWVRHELPFGIVAWTYEDGELIEASVPAVRELETLSYTHWLPSSFERSAWTLRRSTST